MVTLILKGVCHWKETRGLSVNEFLAAEIERIGNSAKILLSAPYDSRAFLARVNRCLLDTPVIIIIIRRRIEQIPLSRFFQNQRFHNEINKRGLFREISETNT